MESKSHKVNAAIQLVPIGTTAPYLIIDQAIGVIQNSGFPFEVGPFSTSIEAKLEDILALVVQIRDTVFNHEAEEILVNLQIQVKKSNDVSASEKTDRFKK